MAHQRRRRSSTGPKILRLPARTRTILGVVALCWFGSVGSSLQAGCYRSAAPARHTVVVPARPTMVWVSPGVWVVEDYPEPVYFADGYYWYPSLGIWYRSRRWDHEFHRFPPDRVPKRIRTLHHEDYRHFHGARDWPRSRPGPGESPPYRPEHRSHEHRQRSEKPRVHHEGHEHGEKR